MAGILPLWIIELSYGVVQQGVKPDRTPKEGSKIILLLKLWKSHRHTENQIANFREMSRIVNHGIWSRVINLLGVGSSCRKIGFLPVVLIKIFRPFHTRVSSPPPPLSLRKQTALLRVPTAHSHQGKMKYVFRQLSLLKSQSGSSARDIIYQGFILLQVWKVKSKLVLFALGKVCVVIWNFRKCGMSWSSTMKAVRAWQKRRVLKASPNKILIAISFRELSNSQYNDARTIQQLICSEYENFRGKRL